jgi:MFS family permease
MAVVVLILTVRLLPDDVRPPARERPKAEKGQGLALWRDARLAPFLLYGFLVATCQTVQTQTLGFLIIDKLKVPPLEAQGFTAVAMMAGAVAGLLAQWGLIRMFRMGPRDLIRWGVALAAGANLLVALAPDYWTVVIGFAVSSLGYGFARPGFTAGASLSVEMHEQAAAAGAIGALNGLNVIVAPLFVWLYEAVHPAPFLLNTAILAGLFIYALKNRVLTNAGERAASDEDATTSMLERSDEGGF